jgi:hypothetical protein
VAKDTVAVVVGGKTLVFLVPAAFVYRGRTYLLESTPNGGLKLTRPK